MPHGAVAPSGPGRSWQRLALAIVPVALAAVLGTIATTPNIPTWYAGLAKPGFTPPNWVFGPVWTILYGAMAYAVWRVLSLPSGQVGRSAALIAFFVQLALNAAWSWAFFALRNPFAGLVVILALAAAILVTLRLFSRLDRIAAWCLVPYLAWVAYAALLNLAIWRLNG